MAVSETNQERLWPGSMGSTCLLEKTLLYCCRLGSTTVVFLKIVDRKTNTTHLHFFEIPHCTHQLFYTLKNKYWISKTQGWTTKRVFLTFMCVFVNLFWDFQFICLFGGVFYKNTMLVSMCLRCFLYELSGLIIDQIFSEVLWKRPGLFRGLVEKTRTFPLSPRQPRFDSWRGHFCRTWADSPAPHPRHPR